MAPVSGFDHQVVLEPGDHRAERIIGGCHLAAKHAEDRH